MPGERWPRCRRTSPARWSSLAFQSVIQALLVPLVDDLKERLPGLDVAGAEIGPEDGARALREGAVDVLLLEADSPTGAPHLEARTTSRCSTSPGWWPCRPTRRRPPPRRARGGDLARRGPRRRRTPSATARLHAAFAHVPTVAHVYSDSDVAISMVAGGLGVALLPSLALLGALRREDIQAVSMAGLGTRSILARHRSTRAEPRREVIAVLDEIVGAAAALDLSAV